MKSWKNLFIKEDETPAETPNEGNQQKVAFPVGDHEPAKDKDLGGNPYLKDILKVYEEGLEKINMPGYDFYEFYSSINAAGSQAEATFKMAFQVGKTMNKTITPEKLVSDADYYVSKIGEVHLVYDREGREKLAALDAQLNTEKNKLESEASDLDSRVKEMKKQILEMEKRMDAARKQLSKIDQAFEPQKEIIRQKLQANDKAKEVSVSKINVIRDGILTYLKSK